MPIQSTVPAALAALVALWTPVVPAGVPVSFGPTPGGDIPADYVTVGWAGDSLPSVEGAGRPSELGNYGQQASEAYGIWCSVSTASGEEVAAARMARTDALFQPLVAAVRANRTLSGVILAPGMADLGTYLWTIESGGSVATVQFRIDVNAPLVM